MTLQFDYTEASWAIAYKAICYDPLYLQNENPVSLRVNPMCQLSDKIIHVGYSVYEYACWFVRFKLTAM